MMPSLMSGAFGQASRAPTSSLLASFMGNPHLHKPYAIRLNSACRELEELIGVPEVEMDLNNVVETVEW